MTDVAPAPTAFISWAHRPNEGLDPDSWIRQIFDFTNALRSAGVDADVDLFHLQDLGVNWAFYGPKMIRESDFTLVAVNRAWKERFQGDNRPTEGAGAAAEANVLHGIFATDQMKLARQLIVVLLPGGTTADVPDELRGFQRVQLTDLSPTGMTPILRLLLRSPEWLPVPLGPPTLLEPIGIFEAPTARDVDRSMVKTHDATGSQILAEPVPGVDVEGWSTVNRALGLNPFGDLVRELLASAAGWPGVSIRGKRNRAKASSNTTSTSVWPFLVGRSSATSGPERASSIPEPRSAHRRTLPPSRTEQRSCRPRPTSTTRCASTSPIVELWSRR